MTYSSSSGYRFDKFGAENETATLVVDPQNEKLYPNGELAAGFPMSAERAISGERRLVS